MFWGWGLDDYEVGFTKRGFGRTSITPPGHQPELQRQTGLDDGHRAGDTYQVGEV